MLTILDPACGSGSFLVGAYTFLLDYYLANYCNENNLKKSLKQGIIYETRYKTYRLSIDEKQRILLGCIFGVDIDPIAVEVTKLSLYLKLLENETEESQPSFFSHKYLPDLDKNICCGNSLIESDFYNGKQLSLFDDEAMRKINAFDWQDSFPAIMKSGGFDCVIGNPPWGQKAAKFSVIEREYFKKKFPHSSVGILDLSRFFIEMSVGLLRSDGVWGQVLPDIILLKNYETTRRFLLDNFVLEVIDHWGKSFQHVNLESCTIIAHKEQKTVKSTAKHKVKIAIHQKDNTVIEHKISQSVFSNLRGCKFNLHLTDAAYGIVQKLSVMRKFSDFFDVHEGIHSGNVRGKLFVDGKVNRSCKKLILGREEVQRYFLKWKGQWVHYTKDFFERNDYAGLGKREYFETKKLVIRRTGDYVLACLDDVGYYFSNNVFVCIPKSATINLKVFLVLLNSRLMTWYYQNIQPRVGKMFAEIKINLINEFPIPIDIPRRSSQRLSVLADQMLTAQARLRNATADADRRLQSQRVAAIDGEIDGLVFDLYGLAGAI
jgi:hypothetical protein